MIPFRSYAVHNIRRVWHVAPAALAIACATGGSGGNADPIIRGIPVTVSPGGELVPVVGRPRVFALRGEALQVAKERVRSGDTTIAPAYKKLLDDARKALREPLLTVTARRVMLAPTGDKHDYLSLSPYWWPDTTKPDGLPYIRRDGVTNPESKTDLDQPRVAKLGSSLQTLALAYYLTGDEAYAERAAAQLRTWFLDSATRMNPHLRFAQLVRGNPRERGSGIIDSRWFIEVVDAAGLIQGSESWTPDDHRALQGWFRSYLEWLRTSPNGAHEFKAINNHGSWFAAQTAAYALFIGDTAAAREIIAGVRPRIGAQITADGQQPIELERTMSMHYASFNIEALSRLAEMGRHVGIDLWNYEAPDGGSLKRAIDHLAPHIGSTSTWPGRQIREVEMETLIIHLRRAATVYGDPRYAAALERLPDDIVRTDRSALLYPDAA